MALLHTHTPPLAANVLELVGNTPILELTNFGTGPCRLFIKLENRNPGGSIKDRMAISMVEAAERSGALRRGGVIVEATAGNTGLGLAVVAAIIWAVAYGVLVRALPQYDEESMREV